MSLTKRIVFQGLTADDHLSAVKHVLELHRPTNIIICVAFLNSRGLSQLQNEIKKNADKTTIITGIRNGITSAQGLEKSLELGCSTYVVDTGSRNIVFHPKLYISRNQKEARILVGSANFTIGGLLSNIEAGVLLNLELQKFDDLKFIERFENQIKGMIAEFPDNVLHISNNAMIEELSTSGRVTDESIAQGPTPSGSSKSRDLDSIPKMNLKTRLITPSPVKSFKEMPEAITTSDELARPLGVLTPASERLTLMWKSNPLKRRDLSIPTGENTNPTGSMLFKKGAFENIDQRHYFRDKVFSDLDWKFDSAEQSKHIERAEGRFQIIIRDVNFGIFSLKISHNTRTDTASYAQRNSMTQIHWGVVRELVGKEDLLERTLWLYRDNVDSGSFVIEID